MDATFAALAEFPAALEKHYALFPAQFVNWAPSSWDGVPQRVVHRHRTALPRAGYRSRGLPGAVSAHADGGRSSLASIDSEAVAKQRDYGRSDAAQVLREFRAARIATLEMLRGLDESQLRRRARFEGYGPVTLRALVHYLCSHDQQHLAGLQWLLGKIEAGRA